MAARLVAAVVAFACACTPSYVEHQRKDLSRFAPAELEAPVKYKGDVRVGKVRVWADVDFRGQSARWRKRITEELDYANQLLTPMLGLRLEVAEVRNWDHHEPGEPLTETVSALTRQDAGDDVAFVIGLTSALAMVSSDQHELGMSELLGKHIVIRGFSDLEERKAFARRYPDIQTEREEVLDAQRRHKQTVLLLHEIGHSLGAIHETDPAWIMHPSYQPQQSSISERNRELMLITLEDRLRPTIAQDPRATEEKLLGAIEKSEWGGWVGAERDALVAQLRQDLAAAKQGSAAPPVPAAAMAQFERARGLVRQGKPADAYRELEPLLAAYPGNATIRLVACQVKLSAKGPISDDAKKVCARAIELAPGDPGPYLVLAAAMLGRDDPAGARAQLAHAAERVSHLPRGAEAAWIEIAGGYQALGDVTRAEQAVASSGVPDHPILIWARRVRARYGLPPDAPRFRIKPDDEGAYVAAVRSILDLTYGGKLGDAERAAAAAERAWPRAPGILAARCDLSFRQGQIARAEGQCKAAIAAYAGAAWAHYLLGVLILRGRDTRAGIASLRRAIGADVELAQAWRALARALERAGDQPGLAQLRADYAARFGQALP